MKYALATAAAVSALAWPGAVQAEAAEREIDQVIIVTATGRPEARERLPGTVQVIDEAEIARSTARSITDLVAENAVAFLSEWTPGQTSINIRGGASDGQGRDFRSQVLVLVNGRRAGTANLSKLSPSDIARIEVVRGPSSVVYGSQNIGGVINLITRDGQTGRGAAVDLTVGSWDFVRARSGVGGVIGPFDYYLGLSSARRDDYHSGQGGGRLLNTDYQRLGATAALGWAIAPEHRIELTGRTDGIYDAGFRGSGANIFSREDRVNDSFDLIYTGEFAQGFGLTTHGYAVRDIDNLRWASPVIRSGNNPVPGTSRDHNRRQLDILGSRLQGRLQPWAGNSLLVGWDYERSQLRSTRERASITGAPITQVPPFDNNQTESVHALYAEDAQSLFGDRLVVRGGLRWTRGTTSFDPTPNLALQRAREENYEATTYATGGTFRLTERLTLRAGAASGFRAPNATELAADFTALGGGRTFGNPNLRPETSEQLEAGVAYSVPGLSLDLALFRNRIRDRIVSRPRQGVPNTKDFVNNPGEVRVAGVEAQLSTDLVRLTDRRGLPWFWTANIAGNYNFALEDEGAPPTANTRRVQRAYEYQLSLGTRFGREEGGRGWSLQLLGLLNGPVWYDTEEVLLIPLAEPSPNFIHRKDPYWIWKARGEVQFSPSFSVFGAVNNLFNVNYHPLFIALDREQVLGDLRFFNGGRGTSSPGREVLFGIRLHFDRIG